jgi:hypothetical protein
MLIDLYDARTGEAIGEFGWGGFKLFNAAHAENQDQSPAVIDKPSVTTEKMPAADNKIPASDKPVR